MKNKERGSALVLVIFAMTMLMLLTVSLSAALTANYKLKHSELVTEQNIYVNDSCESYTKAIIDNMVNDALISSMNKAFAETVRTELMTEDEYIDAVTTAAKTSFQSKIVSKQNTFPNDLQNSLNTITAHYVTSDQRLKGITSVLKSTSDFKNGKCIVTYKVKIEDTENDFTVSYTWDAYSVLTNICEELVKSDDSNFVDPTKINVPIKTIYG